MIPLSKLWYNLCMNSLSKVDKNVVKKIKIEESSSDFSFWQTQSFEKRLETLEIIRNEYNNASQQRFQRVYRIVKQ